MNANDYTGVIVQRLTHSVKNELLNLQQQRERRLAVFLGYHRA